MKRNAILTGVVYGYNEDRAYIHRYSAVMVISLDSHYRPRYGDDRGVLQPTEDKRERLNRGGWRSHSAPVGLLAVSLSNHGLANLDKLREVATVERAVTALNAEVSGARDIPDPSNPKVSLGVYMTVTNAGDLHGDYFELTRALKEHDDMVHKAAQEHEEQRLANVALHNELADRLDALGLTGYHVAAYESPTRFDGLKFEDMEALLDLAEQGSAFIGGYTPGEARKPE